MGLYELQILDGEKNDTYPDGMVGSIYSQFPPLVNAGRPEGVWQCYDIVFHRPHFDGDKVVQPARMTVMLNGVLVQDNTALIGATVHAKVGVYAPPCRRAAAGAAGSRQSRQPCLVPQCLDQTAGLKSPLPLRERNNYRLGPLRPPPGARRRWHG